MTIEEAEEKLRCAADVCGVSASGVFGSGELMPPPEVYEAVDVALVVVLLCVSGCVEGDLELRRRKVRLQVEYIVETRRELDFSKPVPVLTVIVKVLYFVRSWIQDHRLAAHVCRLMRARKEIAELSGIGAGAQTLTVAVVVAAEPIELIMQAAGGNPRSDVYDSRVLVPVFRVPAASDEIDLVHDGRLEQLVEAA